MKPLSPERRWELLLLVVLTATLGVGAIVEDRFFTAPNLGTASGNYAEMLIVAVPLTMLIVMAEIDLSVASVMGLSGALLVQTLDAGLPPGLAIAVALAGALVAGALNGLLVVRVGLSSLVVTIGTLALFRGISAGLMGVESLANLPQWMTDFGFGRAGEVPYTVLLSLALLAPGALFLGRSRIGRDMRAIGMGREVAELSAVRVDRLRFSTFVVTAGTAGIAGVVLASRLGSVRADTATGLELDIITAILLGGVSIFGGKGSIAGVALAFALLASLRSFMSMTGIPADVQDMAVGALLIVAVAASIWSEPAGAAIRRRLGVAPS